MGREAKAHRDEYRCHARSKIQQDWSVCLGNTRARIDYASYSPDEIVVRFHHEMVSMHCFPHGNGRHARLVAIELARLMGLDAASLTWGKRSGQDPVTVRRCYIDALALADATGDYAPLVVIAFS